MANVTNNQGAISAAIGTDSAVKSTPKRVFQRPSEANLEIPDFSTSVAISRLRMNLPNLVETQGKTIKVIANRFLYMYKDTPGILYISDGPMMGMERGYAVYDIQFWDYRGLVEIFKPDSPDYKDIQRLISDLSPNDIFDAITSVNPLPVLVALGYLDSEVINNTYNRLLKINSLTNEGAVTGRAIGADDTLIESIGFSKGLTYADSVAIKPANPDNDPNPVQTPYAKSGYVPDELPASEATVNTSYETVGGDMGLDSEPGKMDITPNPALSEADKARIENEALHDSQAVAAVGEAVDSNPLLTRPAKPAKSNGKVPA